MFQNKQATSKVHPIWGTPGRVLRTAGKAKRNVDRIAINGGSKNPNFVEQYVNKTAPQVNIHINTNIISVKIRIVGDLYAITEATL
jgi:hypothetical protein